VLQSVIVHNKPIDQGVRKAYAEENAEPVFYDIERIKAMGLKVIEEDIIDNSKSMLRHDTDKLAKLLHSML
jgi:2-phospho-L-lactate transferase/gluconeogenesis factor (CofD/UPF0052 family)